MKISAQKSKNSLTEEKIEKIKQRIKERANYMRKAIMKSTEEWPEEYKEKGEENLARLNKLEEKLLNVVDNLDENIINALFELCQDNTPFDKRKEVITFLQKCNNDEILEIAGVICPFTPSPFSDPFFAIYKRYFQWRRYGKIWKRKRKQLIKERGQCELCGSKKDLEVHHLKGLKNENLRDLVVLCRECHRELHKLANLLRQKYAPNDILKDLKRRGAIESSENIEKITPNDIEIYYQLEAYYLLKEKIQQK